MRKNGSRSISVQQYRLTDLFLFALILAVAEFTASLAVRWIPQEAFYTVSFMIPITLLVMMRWGWQSVFYAIASGLLFCIINKASGTQYACYLIGNAFIGLMLIPLYLIGKKKIASKWWASLLFVIGAWVCVYLGRSVVWAIAFAINPIAGAGAADGFVLFSTQDFMSLIIGGLLIIVLRRFEGMFQDQKEYLTYLKNEKEDMMRRAQYGDELAELDDETLSILNKDDNDLY